MKKLALLSILIIGMPTANAAGSACAAKPGLIPGKLASSASEIPSKPTSCTKRFAGVVSKAGRDRADDRSAAGGPVRRGAAVAGRASLAGWRHWTVPTERANRTADPNPSTAPTGIAPPDGRVDAANVWRLGLVAGL